MKRLFMAVRCQPGNDVVSASAHASELAFDAAGNLFWADGPSIFKFTSDGEKSTFATGLRGSDLAFDSEGDLFASDYARSPSSNSHRTERRAPSPQGSRFSTWSLMPSDNLYV